MVGELRKIVDGLGRNRLVWIYLLVGVVAAVMVGAMGYVFHLGNCMVVWHAPLMDAAMEVKLEATMGHLWFEEAICGDRNESVDVVLGHLDKADWYAVAMLEGGENIEGKFRALEDEGMRNDIVAVREKLRQLRELTLERWKAKETSGPGSEIDQRYDATFVDFIGRADKVETHLHDLISDQLKSFRTVQVVSIGLCLVVTVAVGSAFGRFLNRQTLDRLQLQTNNQQLDTSNQQLRSGEQQLRAANQQLVATEQQLRASNQQMQAHEQTLQKRVEDMESFNKLAVGRELRMVELKKEVDHLLSEMGRNLKYQMSTDTDV